MDMDTSPISQILEPISQIVKTWQGAPEETDAGYFRIWQRVAVELAKSLRRWIPEMYFEDQARFEDRDCAYPVIVFAASRPCYGRPKIEFTYNPGDPQTLKAALRSIGNPTRSVLAQMEKRLRDAGRPDLAIRYAPFWYQDVLRAVQTKPKILISLLAAETRLIDAVIQLGATRKAARFHRAATLALRSVAGLDMRVLAMRALERTSEVLAANHFLLTSHGANGIGDLVDGGILEADHTLATRRPDFGIGGEENGHDGSSDSGSQVGDAGVVSDVNASPRDPASQLV
jgi:hypothetical protein